MSSNKNYIREIINTYCVIDVETTGLSCNWDDIIEIGILKVKNNEIVDKYSQLINPGFLIDSFITDITGITNNMLKDKPSIFEVRNDVLNFLENSIIIGHNTSFDINFIKSKFKKEIENNYIDTLQFCRKLYPELEHHRLTDMCQFLNLDRSIHRSIEDCIATKQLYDAIKNKMETENIQINDIFSKKKHNRTNYVDTLKAESLDFDEDNFFYNKHCVFTGTLEKMVRKDAMQLILNVGGVLDNGVTKETNYLILGNNDYCKSIKDGKSSKHKKAEKLKFDGKDIEIIDEDTFYFLINQ